MGGALCPGAFPLSRGKPRGVWGGAAPPPGPMVPPPPRGETPRVPAVVPGREEQEESIGLGGGNLGGVEPPLVRPPVGRDDEEPGPSGDERRGAVSANHHRRGPGPSVRAELPPPIVAGHRGHPLLKEELCARRDGEVRDRLIERGTVKGESREARDVEPLPARDDGLRAVDLLLDVPRVRSKPVRLKGEAAHALRALHGLTDGPLLVDQRDPETSAGRRQG